MEPQCDTASFFLRKKKGNKKRERGMGRYMTSIVRVCFLFTKKEKKGTWYETVPFRSEESVH